VEVAVMKNFLQMDNKDHSNGDLKIAFGQKNGLHKIIDPNAIGIYVEEVMRMHGSWRISIHPGLKLALIYLVLHWSLNISKAYLGESYRKALYDAKWILII
jgi:hypothetical protein